MIKKIMALIVASGLLLGGCASQLQQNNENSQNSDTNSVQSALPLLNNVSYSSLSELSYTDRSIKLDYGADPLQYGQLYLPKTVSLQSSLQQKAPLVVFIHGGCWLNAYDISHSRAFSQAVAANGFAVWSLEYRRTGDVGGGWPGSLIDIKQGIAFAKASLAQYGVDTSRIVLSGHSAGGQLALLAGSQIRHSDIAAVIGLAAITDMQRYANGSNSCQSATAQFMGGSYSDLTEQYQQASPNQQLMHPATLLLQGSTDKIVPLSQASLSGIPYKLVDNAGHFDWIHPQTAAYKQFVILLQELLPL
ncbi:alpha/beta hydrolase fold domain-containing protein [Arsukibacterium sp.]|uniref:alpha/beta hydrolase fold domain-containing protein n=1 Tax=Arsukibacterium sp. TaxID=1977258 RepID=UPI0035695CC3